MAQSIIRKVTLAKPETPRVWESGKKGLRKTTLLAAAVHFGNGLVVAMPVQASSIGAPTRHTDLTIDPVLPTYLAQSSDDAKAAIDASVRLAYRQYPGIRNVVADAYSALQTWNPKTGKSGASETAADFLSADDAGKPETDNGADAPETAPETAGE